MLPVADRKLLEVLVRLRVREGLGMWVLLILVTGVMAALGSLMTLAK